jgi:hypothetical protein
MLSYNFAPQNSFEIVIKNKEVPIPGCIILLNLIVNFLSNDNISLLNDDEIGELIDQLTPDKLSQLRLYLIDQKQKGIIKSTYSKIIYALRSANDDDDCSVICDILVDDGTPYDAIELILKEFPDVSYGEILQQLIYEYPENVFSNTMLLAFSFYGKTENGDYLKQSELIQPYTKNNLIEVAKSRGYKKVIELIQKIFEVKVYSQKPVWVLADKNDVNILSYLDDADYEEDDTMSLIAESHTIAQDGIDKFLSLPNGEIDKIEQLDSEGKLVPKKDKVDLVSLVTCYVTTSSISELKLLGNGNEKMEYQIVECLTGTTSFDKKKPSVHTQKTEWDSDMEYERRSCRLYGPVNSMLTDRCLTTPTKDGRCRMLTCTCRPDDEDDHYELEVGSSNSWWISSNERCQVCTNSISGIESSIRIPVNGGGWIGCYCSVECITKEPTRFIKKEDEFLFSRMNGQLISFGIIDRNAVKTGKFTVKS